MGASRGRSTLGIGVGMAIRRLMFRTASNLPVATHRLADLRRQRAIFESRVLGAPPPQYRLNILDFSID
jgi:hypothetical protein